MRPAHSLQGALLCIAHDTCHVSALTSMTSILRAKTLGLG